MIIDTHAHLTDKRYNDTLNQMISEFKQNGLDKVFTVGYNLQSSIECVKLAERNNDIYAVIGIHPSDIHELNKDTLNQLKQLANSKKVVAIGEIGLDYHWVSNNKPEQKNGFIKQLELANQLNLPFVIHSRDANEDIIEVLNENKHLINNGGVLHCFGESFEFYKEIEKLNLYVSIGGALTFKNSQVLQEAVKQIPLNKILLETDCPYLTPMPFRGKEINQPKYVKLVAQKIAELKNISVKEVNKITTQNAYNLFKKLNKG